MIRKVVFDLQDDLEDGLDNTSGLSYKYAFVDTDYGTYEVRLYKTFKNIEVAKNDKA